MQLADRTDRSDDTDRTDDGRRRRSPVDRLLVDDGADRPVLARPWAPEGWHEGVLPAWVRAQPRARRSTLLAAAFALAAVAYGPLGMLALLTGQFTAFVLGSCIVAALLLLPWPRGGAALPAERRATADAATGEPAPGRRAAGEVDPHQ